MRKALLLFSIPLTVALTACTGPSTEAAAESASPPVTIPVGPIPGPKTAPNSPQNPFSQSDSVALAAGRQLFLDYNCYGCHGGHAGGGMGPNLRQPDWIYGGTDAQVFNSIAQGRGKGMPAWGVKIPEDQIWKLVAYIKSLGTDHEPSPPS